VPDRISVDRPGAGDLGGDRCQYDDREPTATHQFENYLYVQGTHAVDSVPYTGVRERAVRVSIVKRQALASEKLRYLTDRLFALEHELDTRPTSVWHLESYAPNLYAILLKSSDLPIGILYVGGPKNAIDVSWWIDSRYRGLGYGGEAVDMLAALLKADGVTGVGGIMIQAYEGNYIASSKLAKRLRKLFD
jgi:hypothetical protein